MRLNAYLPIITIVSTLISNGAPIRTKDKMYEVIEGSKPCYRRLNATHQVGCSSNQGGSTGVIHYCTSQWDLDFILRNGSAAPYIPIIPTTLFRKENLNYLKSSPKISGLLVYNDLETQPESFTHDLQCPNTKFNLDESCGGSQPLWNHKGSGFLYEHLPFPVFFVDNSRELKFARDCFAKHNNHSYDTQRDRALCSVELLSFMYAAKNTPTCIRRSHLAQNLNTILFCDPLGDRNIWATLQPLNHTMQKKFIIVAARIDTTSMFEMTAGAVNPISGLVTLLSIAKLLNEMMMTADDSSDEKEILFLLLNGESYDYIGSQRFLYDLNAGNFPVERRREAKLPVITAQDISLYVELSQISQSGQIIGHYLKSSKVLDAFVRQLGKFGAKLVNFNASVGTVPPSSLHTFLRNDSNFPGLVLTDHRREYKNSYYNSIYDNATNLGFNYLNLSTEAAVPADSIQRYIGNVSQMLAETLYFLVKGNDHEGEATADVQLIDELFHCYLENANCRVHRAVQKMKLRTAPFSLYVGVDRSRNPLVDLIALTLGWITGTDTGPGSSSCQNNPPIDGYKFYNFSQSLDNLNETRCYRVSMNFTDAISPAFIIDDYDWSSGLYSSWSESSWGEMRVRIFLKASAAHENMTIAVGSIVLIFSFIFVYIVKSRSDVLFNPTLPTLPPTDC